MAIIDRLHEIIDPIVDDLGVELFDLEFAGSTVSVTIDKPPTDTAPGGIDLSDITAVTRAISRAFDEHDPIDGHYSIEVSSPGLERTLRVPRHFERAVGSVLAVKTVPGFEAGRRLKGTLVQADTSESGGIELVLEDPAGLVCPVAYAEIERARTVFEWGPEPKPSRPAPPGGTGTNAKKPVKPSKSSKTSKAPKVTKPAKAPKAGSADPGPQGASAANHAKNTESAKSATQTTSTPEQSEQKKVAAS